MISKLSIESIIKILKLTPHVEGGFSSVSYQDHDIIPGSVLPKDYNGTRTFGNAIYFLLPDGTKSICHRIKMNELWHFYLGDPVELFHILPSGKVKKVLLGQDILQGQQLTYVVPKMHWFGAIPKGPNYSLVGCSTSPGFEFSDWEKGERNYLLKKYPKIKDIIIRLT